MLTDKELDGALDTDPPRGIKIVGMENEPIELLDTRTVEEYRDAVREYYDYLQKTVSDGVEQVIINIAAGSSLSPFESILDNRGIGIRDRNGYLVPSKCLGPGTYHLISSLSGLSRSHVSGVLQGKRGASLKTLKTICEVTGVELEKLVAFIDNQKGVNGG